MKKKILSLFLVCVMLLSLMPMAAVATVADGDVAKIGDQGYATLQAAINAAEDGDKITMLANASEAAIEFKKANTTVTLDLNGYTVDGKAYDAGTLKISMGLRVLSGKLILTDTSTTQTGKITCTEEASYYQHYGIYVFNQNSSDVEFVMDGGTIDSFKYGIYVGKTTNGSTTVTINDGVISAMGTDDSYAVILNNASANLAINGGTFVGQGNSLRLASAAEATEVVDGHFKGAVFENGSTPVGVLKGGYYTTDVSAYVADGYECVSDTSESGYSYKVQQKAAANVAKIGTTGYATLAAAIDAAADGAVIELLANVEEDVSITGKAVYIKETADTAKNSGNVDAECFTITQNKGVLYGDLSKAVDVVKAGDVTPLYSTVLFFIQKNITLTSDIELPFYGNTNSSLWYYGGISPENAVLDLNGHTISQGHGNDGGYWYGSVRVEYTNLTIKDSSTEKTGKITGVGSCVVVNAETESPATLTLESGTLSVSGDIPHGGNGIVQTQQAGKFVMTGGTIDGSVVAEGKLARGLFELTYLDQGKGKGEVSISGGNFKIVADGKRDTKNDGSYVSPDGFLFNYYNDGTKPTVTGGTFDFDPSAYVATGYTVTDNENGTWTVVPVAAANVAKIGTDEYATLAAAIAAVPTNGTETTITMIGDERLTGDVGVTIPAGCKITLDLAGKTISGLSEAAKASSLIDNYGYLTIMDSTDTNKNGTGDGKISFCAERPDETYGYGNSTIRNYGTMVVESGYIVNETTNTGVTAAIDNSSNGVNAYLTINGGKLESENKFAIRAHCNSSTCENEVTVNNGIIIGKRDAILIQSPSDGTQKGVLTINGGTLTATQDGKGVIQYWVCGNLSTSNTQVVIKDGKFNGGKIVELDVNNSVDATNYITISGGYYNLNDESLTGFIAPGYECVENTDSTTKDAYPYKVVAQEKQVEVPTGEATAAESGNVTIGTDTDAPVIEVKVKESEDAEAQQNEDTTVAAEVAQQINTLLSNTEVSGFTETKIDTATAVTEQTKTKVEGTGGQQFDLSMILKALKTEADKDTDLSTGVTADDKLTVNTKDYEDTDVSKTIRIDLTKAEVITAQPTPQATTVTMSSNTYDVKPVATITVTKGDTTETVTAVIPNDAITAPITFRLPVPDDWTNVKVMHQSNNDTAATDFGTYPAQGDQPGKHYVELSSKEFSFFTTINANAEPLSVVKVNDIPYTKEQFPDAVEAAEAAEGDAAIMYLLGDVEIWEIGETEGTDCEMVREYIDLTKDVKVDRNGFGFSVVHRNNDGTEDGADDDYCFVFVDVPTDLKVEAVVTNTPEGGKYTVGGSITVDIVLKEDGEAVTDYAGVYVNVKFTDKVTAPAEAPTGWTILSDGTFRFYDDDGDTLGDDGVLGTFTLTAAKTTGGSAAAITDIQNAGEFVTDGGTSLSSDAIAVTAVQANANILGVLHWNDGQPTVSGKTYDGAAWGSSNDDYTATVVEDTETLEVTPVYYETETATEAMTAAPKDAGTYYVEFTASATGYAPLKSSKLSFEITKKPLTITFEVTDAVYDGKLHDFITTAPSVGDGLVGTDTVEFVKEKDSGKEIGSYDVKVSIKDNTNYTATPVTKTAKIDAPNHKIILKPDYIPGYTMVYVFVNGTARVTYDSNKVYKITNLGYNVADYDTTAHTATLSRPTSESAPVGATIGKPSGWQVYAYLVHGNVDATNVEDLVQWKPYNQGLAGSIPPLSRINDVNASLKVDLADAVAVVTSYTANSEVTSKLATYMATILRCDVNGDGVVNSADAAQIKNQIAPIPADPTPSEQSGTPD